MEFQTPPVGVGVVVCNRFLHECTGLQLARGLAELLELTFPIDSEIDDGGHFSVTDDPITVHCTDANLALILDAEKNGLPKDSQGARIQKKCHYEQILKIARRSIRDSRQIGSISDDMLFLLFSCLHEFGHATDLFTMSESERNKQAKAREDAKARAEKLFQSKAKNGNSERGYAVLAEEYAISYRKLPLEKQADFIASDYLVQLLKVDSFKEKLIAACGGMERFGRKDA